MSEVNQSIVAQTCAKIASDLVNNLERTSISKYHSPSLDSRLDEFEYAFERVYNIISSKYVEVKPSKGGRKVPVISVQDMSSKLEMFKASQPEAGTKVSSQVVTSEPTKSLKPTINFGTYTGVLPQEPHKAD